MEVQLVSKCAASWGSVSQMAQHLYLKKKQQNKNMMERQES